MSIHFRTEPPHIADTMKFELVYPEPLQYNFEEKVEFLLSNSIIGVWMYDDAELVGETYGARLGDVCEGLGGCDGYDKWSTVYCWSNTVIPPGKGYGTIIKAAWLGVLKGLGNVKMVVGHARPGGSQALNAKFGARFIETFYDWAGTGEPYRLYETKL